MALKLNMLSSKYMSTQIKDNNEQNELKKLKKTVG